MDDPRIVYLHHFYKELAPALLECKATLMAFYLCMNESITTRTGMRAHKLHLYASSRRLVQQTQAITLMHASSSSLAFEAAQPVALTCIATKRQRNCFIHPAKDWLEHLRHTMTQCEAATPNTTLHPLRRSGANLCGQRRLPWANCEKHRLISAQEIHHGMATFCATLPVLPSPNHAYTAPRSMSMIHLAHEASTACPYACGEMGAI